MALFSATSELTVPHGSAAVGGFHPGIAKASVVCRSEIRFQDAGQFRLVGKRHVDRVTLEDEIERVLFLQIEIDLELEAQAPASDSEKKQEATMLS